MAPLVLEGESLGEKHRYYNKLLKAAIAETKCGDLENIKYEDNDIDNMMKIDIACKTRNVEYILEVLKSEDLLYVSRALKRCVWLVTEPQYAHIINPQYLHSQVFPHMTTKSITKVMLHIRTYLKDEKRVEEFYNYKKETNITAAFKWLPHCSHKFKLKEIENHENFPIHIFKRIYKQSPECVVEYLKNTLNSRRYNTCVARLLAKSHTDVFLDIFDSVHAYQIPKICGSTTTQAMLKRCPDRIITHYYNYYKVIHIPTFVNYIKKERGIENFLLQQPNFSSCMNWVTFENLKYFLDEIPQENTTKILKKKFNFYVEDSDEEDEEEDSGEDSESERSSDNSNSGSNESDEESVEEHECVEEPMTLSELYHKIEKLLCTNTPYIWYRFAPFENARNDLQNLIYAESCPEARHSLLLVLLESARKNPQNIHEVLEYYHDRHINELFKHKIKFVASVDTQVDTHNFDTKTWTLLNNIFRSMEVYIDTDNKVQVCIKSIIVYNLLHDEPIPEIIENKFDFETLKNYRTKLNLINGDKIFKYLFNYLINKMAIQKIRHETEAKDMVTLVENLWKLLKDWNKEQQCYHLVVDEIKKLLSITKEVTWTIKLSGLYNMLGPWRRQLFEESLLLCTNVEASVNMLKHAPQLLVRHSSELQERHATEPPHRLLHKLRIYYADTLAPQFADEYLAHLNDSTGHKALIRGLYTLLPTRKLIKIIEEHAPTENKVEWAEENEIQLNIRRHIAKNMHLARPPLSTEVVLWYAKGDYLQYAQLSLNSIYHNLKSVQIREHILKLLNAPVSIQKHGIRLAFNRLEPEELKSLFMQLWKASKNCTIRAVLFTCTFKLLSKATDEVLINDLWTLISTYINDLNHDDNRLIFLTLGNVKDVPPKVRVEFYMKSCTFIMSLPEKANVEVTIKGLIRFAPGVMEHLDPEFVENVLLGTKARENILKGKKKYMRVVSAYLLCTKEEAVQMQRYNKILAPILEECIRAKSAPDTMLTCICHDFSKYVIEMKMNQPHAIFNNIQILLENHFSVQKNYFLVTNWKLSVALMKLFCHLQRSLFKDHTWLEMQKAAIEPFGKMCLSYLKKEMQSLFPSIYIMLASACSCVYNNFNIDEVIALDMIAAILDTKIIESYLLGLQMLPTSFSWHSSRKERKLREVSGIIVSHPSKQVKMLYHRHFGGINY